jgi:hypothetical protein
MKILRTMYHLVQADFLERVRRYSFLIVLGLTVYAGYLSVPPQGAGYRVLQVGITRGIYNSAWIGLMFGLIIVMITPFFDFYLVRNAIERDRKTGVGQIIATTPIGKLTYVVGKWLSNLAVLILILSIMTAMAILMQLIRAEDMAVNLQVLVSTIWLMGLPVLMGVAAISILFESVSFLRGSLGNVAFFFLLLTVMGITMTGAVDQTTELAKVTNDPYGYTRQLVAIQRQVLSEDPASEVGTGLIITGRDIESTFVWEGIDWTGTILLERVMWAAIAIGIVLIAAIPFDRFDPARRLLKPERKSFASCLSERIKRIRRGDWRRPQYSEGSRIQEVTVTSLTSLPTTPSRGFSAGVLVGELTLMLKGRSFIWYIATIGLITACLVSPMNFFETFLVPIVWLWPVFVFSQMGVREFYHNTIQVVFSTPYPMRRQLPAIWLAGVIAMMIVGGSIGIRFAVEGEITSLLAWLAGTLFPPSLALFLGVWVGNSRGFELIYALIWYIGVINKIPGFDFAGITAEGLAKGIPQLYLGITVGCVVLAFFGRWRQIRI